MGHKRKQVVAVYGNCIRSMRRLADRLPQYEYEFVASRQSVARRATCHIVLERFISHLQRQRLVQSIPRERLIFVSAYLNEAETAINQYFKGTA